jgi:hypothetical protein
MFLKAKKKKEKKKTCILLRAEFPSIQVNIQDERKTKVTDIYCMSSTVPGSWPALSH